ncbi:MAG: YeeE/YedE thiosulfate transporter family protein [Zoogloea sp.]|uniref:YeeE/YedE family protein n=1 Tax=Zoogloea sp. TaxID=49181 RepID=UPI0026249A5B|nr:YeeE/YedE thiosulfate transporter family protein [Zoogloea sp.]MDD2991058.1 YeeE/YedE thiosulfate transporter family protein [Zoogloea sp.]
MKIDWVHFTPWESLGGGALIGLAAVVLMVGCRRIAGISGIFGEVLTGARDGLGWRLAFLLGLCSAPWLMPGVVEWGEGPRFGISWPALFVAGLVTGYGTRIARGCTSGHGVCGLSRLSPRSLVAVLCFMGAGVATVTVLRLVSGGAS